MTTEEIIKAVEESVKPLTEQLNGLTKKEVPTTEEKMYRVGGLEEVPGTNGVIWQLPKPNKEECSGIAAMINQGTLDIMSNPDKDPLQAMADNDAKRKLKESLK